MKNKHYFQNTQSYQGSSFSEFMESVESYHQFQPMISGYTHFLAKKARSR